MPKAKPGPIVASFYRAPVVLYRAHLGWILGGHFLMLTTTGRKTGRTRRTVVEVVRRADRPAGGLPTLWVVASRGRHTDWYANAVAGGSTGVIWKSHAFTPRLRALDTAERAELLADYRLRHPRAAAMLGTAVLGRDFTAESEDLRRLATELRALRLEPPGADVGTAR